jgi:hypothetical protein
MFDFLGIRNDQETQCSRRDLESQLREEKEEESPRSVTASVYKFKPSPACPKLRLLSGRGVGLVTLKAVVRRKAIVICGDRQGEWWYLSCCGYQGWARVTNDMLEKGVLTKVDQLYRYEDWRGNNYFFCNGRIMMGSDAKFFVLTNIMLLCPAALSFAFVIPKCYYSVVVGLCMAGLLVYCYVYLWLAALVEPGILKRNEFAVKVRTHLDTFYYL